MADVRRIKPQEARQKVKTGEALLVCAYESEEMCGKLRFENALTMGELNSRLAERGKDQELIFYCK